MVNLTHAELAEITTKSLPPASLDALTTLRNQSCTASFSLQPQQKFLRRVLSPDSPTRNLLMVHGTGVGKTCSAIQVAEEYIIRPEFQDKKVMVVASGTVQDNFRTQIFDMSRVHLDKASDTLSSKQCTGRRYLDMLLRIEAEPKNWANPEVMSRLERTADRIIDEFYEFSAYTSFGNRLLEKLTGTEKDIDEDWVHENFDNRLLIIDEAHNISSDKTQIASGLEKLVKVANGLVLVLLTATPMFDSYEEIVYYMNLFLWNERKQPFKTVLKASDFFTSDAELKGGETEVKFREWCQDYVSYVKGESPFTFPFRLPPPTIASTTEMTKAFNGPDIADKDRIKYLSLVASVATGVQKKVIVTSKHEDDDSRRRAMIAPTISVFPGDKEFSQVLTQSRDQYSYIGEPFLTPEKLPEHAAKFVSVLKSIETSRGVCMVYSNYVERGALPFALALEEHGYVPWKGSTLLAKPNYKGPSKGRYMMLSSNASPADISAMLSAVKNRANVSGKNIKVVVTSPLAAEGIDFRFIRQVHVLDPWWNMSRIEQVIGRALRTCSHQDLIPEEQNCTVYLHIIRAEETREAFDEYTYRTKVEAKGMRIAKVRKYIAESAMDCPLQVSLPADWRELVVPQIRDEGHQQVAYRLKGMLAPTFDEAPDIEQCKVTESVADPDHVRPLSSYLDSRDEILSLLGKLFIDKSIWDREQLFSALRPYSRDVVIYTLQQAIASAFRFVDSFGRPSLLESKGDLYALAPIDVPNSTLIERTTKPSTGVEVPFPEPPPPMAELPPLPPDILDAKRTAFTFPGDAGTRFSDEVKNGFIFDHEFSPAEKKAYLATEPALPFADRLRIPGTDIVVTGEEQDLIGEDLTKYKEWTKKLIDRFVADKGKLVASMAPNKILSLTPSDGDETPVRKSNKPVVSGTGANPVVRMKNIAKFLDVNQVGIPTALKGSLFHIYAELLAREQHNCVWYTPEEMRALETDEAKKALKKFLKD